MLTLQGGNYTHSTKDILFRDLYLRINKHAKIALIGNNGAGKSTLLKILAGILPLSSGILRNTHRPYYVPQIVGQFNDLTVSQALGIDDKLNALQEILNGNATEQYLSVLDDDWQIEERCREAFSHWLLQDLELNQKMETLSGGQKTKVFLAGIRIHQPEIVLLDEPSNHLDLLSRNILYDYISTTTDTLIIVSHDRNLLNLLHAVYVLNEKGIITYGGNYDFYVQQKKSEDAALNQELKDKEKALRKAKEVEKETLKRKQKLDARGKKKQEKAGLPTISMKTLKDNAEKSTSRLKSIHDEKVQSISHTLTQLRHTLPDQDKIKIDFENSSLHTGKKLIEARNINFAYSDRLLWKKPMNFQINSGERIALKGSNGSGKTTLIKLILNELQPLQGKIERSEFKAIYFDQEYSLINNQLSIYEQVQTFNTGNLPEHEVKIRLHRFLFTKEDWEKICILLSGGEKMRLLLCCLAVSRQAPDLIILDEPTNNLDIQNIELLTHAINRYKGTLLVVCHDEFFLNEITVESRIDLS